MYINGPFVQSILYIPASVLLLLSYLRLTISLVVVEVVLINFMSWLDRLFSMVAVMELVGRIMHLILL